MKANFFKYSFLGVALAAAFTACTSEGDSFDYDHNVILISGTETDPLVKFTVEDTPSSYSVVAVTTNKLDKDTQVTFAIDNSLVAKYNEEHSTGYYAVPDGAVELETSTGTIAAGKAYSTPAVVKVLSTENFEEGCTYIIPVTIKSTGGIDALESCRTIYLKVAQVFQFTSLNISNTNMYSNIIFDDAKKMELNNFTYEIKCYCQDFHRIARLCSFTSKDESRSSMLRFGENGYDIKSLQWVSPSGSIVSNSTFSENRWYMISLTYDGSKLRMYVDGVLDAEGDGDGKPVDFQRLELGMSWTGYPASQYFTGRIAELRVWDRALSTAEITANLCGTAVNSNGLRAYWKMNEGSGHIFYDSTKNGYDIDWSKSQREINEGAGLVATPECANYVAWDNDEINKCAQ